MAGDPTKEELEILKINAKRREFLRQVFIREKSNPFKHMSEEGGAVVSY